MQFFHYKTGGRLILTQGQLILENTVLAPRLVVLDFVTEMGLLVSEGSLLIIIIIIYFKLITQRLVAQSLEPGARGC